MKSAILSITFFPPMRKVVYCNQTRYSAPTGSSSGSSLVYSDCCSNCSNDPFHSYFYDATLVDSDRRSDSDHVVVIIILHPVLSEIRTCS